MNRVPLVEPLRSRIRRHVEVARHSATILDRLIADHVPSDQRAALYQHSCRVSVELGMIDILAEFGTDPPDLPPKPLTLFPKE